MSFEVCKHNYALFGIPECSQCGDARQKVFESIRLERRAQKAKWGDENQVQNTLPVWIAILVEEVGEVAAEVLNLNPDWSNNPQGVSTNSYTWDALRKEMVQVAAVAVAAVEAIDGRRETTETSEDGNKSR